MLGSRLYPAYAVFGSLRLIRRHMSFCRLRIDTLLDAAALAQMRYGLLSQLCRCYWSKAFRKSLVSAPVGSRFRNFCGIMQWSRVELNWTISNRALKKEDRAVAVCHTGGVESNESNKSRLTWLRKAVGKGKNNEYIKIFIEKMLLDLVTTNSLNAIDLVRQIGNFSGWGTHTRAEPPV